MNTNQKRPIMEQKSPINIASLTVLPVEHKSSQIKLELLDPPGPLPSSSPPIPLNLLGGSATCSSNSVCIRAPGHSCLSGNVGSSLCVCVCLCVCVLLLLCVCVCVCDTHTHTHTYTHTHTCTHLGWSFVFVVVAFQENFVGQLVLFSFAAKNKK